MNLCNIGFENIPDSENKVYGGLLMLYTLKFYFKNFKNENFYIKNFKINYLKPLNNYNDYSFEVKDDYTGKSAEAKTFSVIQKDNSISKMSILSLKDHNCDHTFEFEGKNFNKDTIFINFNDFLKKNLDNSFNKNNEIKKIFLFFENYAHIKISDDFSFKITSITNDLYSFLIIYLSDYLLIVNGLLNIKRKNLLFDKKFSIYSLTQEMTFSPNFFYLKDKTFFFKSNLKMINQNIFTVKGNIYDSEYNLICICNQNFLLYINKS